jgi:hypothetical protein
MSGFSPVNPRIVADPFIIVREELLLDKKSERTFYAQNPLGTAFGWDASPDTAHLFPTYEAAMTRISKLPPRPNGERFRHITEVCGELFVCKLSQAFSYDPRGLASESIAAAQEACNKLHPQNKVRDTSSPGKKTDAGKLRWHLLPFDAVREVVKVLDLNAKPAGKYEERNWEKGIAYSRLYGAAMRHLTTWFQDREDKDSESELSHLAHAACCILFLLAYTLRGKNEFDDRPETK